MLRNSMIPLEGGGRGWEWRRSKQSQTPPQAVIVSAPPLRAKDLENAGGENAVEVGAKRRVKKPYGLRDVIWILRFAQNDSPGGPRKARKSVAALGMTARGSGSSLP